MTRCSAAAVVALVAILSGCRTASPAQASSTVSVSRTPDGMAIAGATAVVFTAAASGGDGALTLTWDLGDGKGLRSCDDNVVLVEGTASGDLRSFSGTYTPPAGPPQPMLPTRE